MRIKLKDAELIKDEAFELELMFCRNCDYPISISSRDDCDEYSYCSQSDPYSCPAVEAVQDEFKLNEDDVMISKDAIYMIAPLIAMYSDNDNNTDMASHIKQMLYGSRLEAAKLNKLF